MLIKIGGYNGSSSSSMCGSVNEALQPSTLPLFDHEIIRLVAITHVLSREIGGEWWK